MNIIQFGPNLGSEFPTKMSVENFDYNGFGIMHKPGFASWEIVRFIDWTLDPGIGKFMCSDDKERLIPSSCISPEYYAELPPRPVLDPFKGIGVFFGEPSNSD